MLLKVWHPWGPLGARTGDKAQAKQGGLTTQLRRCRYTKKVVLVHNQGGVGTQSMGCRWVPRRYFLCRWQWWKKAGVPSPWGKVKVKVIRPEARIKETLPAVLLGT